MTEDEIIKRAIAGVERLLDEQSDLLVRNLNERTITHWLAVYLHDVFPEHDVDCEYNRNGPDAKWVIPQAGLTFADRPPLDDDDARTVYPDIIVHRRPREPRATGNEENLLVVEAKKSTNNDDRLDHAKLAGFLDPAQPYKYRVALFLRLRTGAPRVGARLVFKTFDGEARRVAIKEPVLRGENPPD